jgi:predicted TPR repeat methyltransferase
MTDALETARQHFQAGVQQLQAHRLDDAARSFEAALALAPGRASVLTNLGAVRLMQGRPADALALLEQACAAEPGHAEGWLQQGLALDALGRDAPALACFERALALAPDEPEARLRAALLLNRGQRHAEAHAQLQQLLHAQPQHARGWSLLGQTLQSLGRHAEALPAYERALALAPAQAWTWTLLGGLLKDLGRRAEARRAFEQAIAHGGDADYNRYFIAALDGAGTPARAPGAYVQQLFDGYAGSFDSHLVQVLHYRSPAMLAARLRALGRHFRHALDLGCGTGLCGPLLAPLAVRIDGIDLSQGMLDRAAALGVYAQLTRADLVDHLRGSDQRHDLLLAADVFTYLGDLDAVHAGAQRVLEPAGVLCYSVERAADAVDFELRESLRYAHGEPYLRRLAQRHGFDVLGIERATLREDQRRPIEGLLVLMQRR